VKRTLRRIAGTLLVLVLVGALLYAFLPRPVAVEAAAVARGPMQVTVDEDGRTRIKEEFTISAPLAGRLARITLDEGDSVEAGKTLLASIDPMDPSLLDPRALAEAEARASAAQAALDRAGAAVASAGAALELAQTELARLREAGRGSAASPKELDEAVLVESLRSEELRAAEFARDVARFELEQARAALLYANPSIQESGVGGGAVRRFEILAPVSGRVLRVLQKSAGVVTPGQALIQIGDPADLEVEVDVLSTDAVPIRPGAPVTLERWGGDHPLRAVVRLVEPAAFLKISALGVEEQRVNVIIDFVDPPEARAGLGDAFRVEARIVVWQADDVLQVPTGALFRDADSWAVFAIKDGRARTRRVTLGRRNSEHAQVLEGLAPGEEVILYPGDTVREGVRVSVALR
jgi:HlyD family secretion protein